MSMAVSFPPPHRIELINAGLSIETDAKGMSTGTRSGPVDGVDDVSSDEGHHLRRRPSQRRSDALG